MFSKIYKLTFVAILLISCKGTPTGTPISQEDAIATAFINLQQTQTAGAPTNTATPLPPTRTPLPTVTSTPLPQPIILTGTGDSIVDIDKWSSVALLKVTYTGGSNFVVRNYGAGNDVIDLLVNTIGAYSGSQLIDIYDNDQTVRFEVKASGPWEIQVLPIIHLRKETMPGTITGIGDDVVLLQGTGTPDMLRADASQSTSNFIVYALTNFNFELVFNEIAPYTGTVLIDGTTNLLQIKAEGPWSIEVITK